MPLTCKMRVLNTVPVLQKRVVNGLHLCAACIVISSSKRALHHFTMLPVTHIYNVVFIFSKKKFLRKKYCRVHQRNCFGPLLFPGFTNDLPHVFENVVLHLVQMTSVFQKTLASSQEVKQIEFVKTDFSYIGQK